MTPEAAAYQRMVPVPVGVAARLATVGLLAEQKDWDALPVGAAGVVLTVAVTASLVVLSHPFTVWLA